MFIVLPKYCQAANFGDVIINEVMWMGSEKSDADEWLELKNNTSEEIDISKWKIINLGKNLNIKAVGDYSLGSNTIVPKEGYLLIANYSFGHNNTILDIEPDIVTSSISLLNEKNGNILLFDEKDNLIDEVLGKESWPSGDKNNKYSMERVDKDGLSIKSWQSSYKAMNIIEGSKTLATPKTENSIKPINPNINCIRINEFMPYPAKDKEEWVELKNNCDYEVNLNYWSIGDNKKQFYFDNSASILSKSLLLVDLKDTKLVLNNTGEDAVKLIYYNDLVEESYYSEAKENRSYSLINDRWYWNCNPTPGIENIFKPCDIVPEINYKKIDNLSQIKRLNEGTKIQAKGIVTVKPGQLFKQYFFIQDELAGTQVYLNSGDFMKIKLEIGDEIIVYGEVSFPGMNRIKITSVDNIVKTGKQKDITTHNSNDLKNNLGQKIKVTGELLSSSGKIFYISHNNQEIKVEIKPDFPKPKMKKGDIIIVTGILYMSSLSKNITILPLISQDLEVKDADTSQKETNTNQTNGDKRTFDAIVNSLPGQLSDKYFYVQNDNHGVQIYSSKEGFPNLSIGDQILVTGKYSLEGKRLIIYDKSDIKILNSKVLSASKILYYSQLEKLYGKLIYASGKISKEKSKNYLLLSTGDKIYINFKNIKISTKTNDDIEIYAIVEYYSGNYHISPRTLSDIKITRQTVNKEPEKNKPTDNKKYKIIKTTSIFKRAYAASNKSHYLENPPKNDYNKLIENILKSIVLTANIFIIFYGKRIYS